MNKEDFINSDGNLDYIRYVSYLEKENEKLQSQLKYLRSGEYYNQLRFERDMLQHVVDNNEVSKEDKEFIDMTHRNTELLEENQQLKEEIERLKKELYTTNMAEEEMLERDHLRRYVEER